MYTNSTLIRWAAFAPWALALAASASCTRGPTIAAAHPAPQPAVAAAERPTPVGPLALGAVDIALPPCPANPTTAQGEFCHAATRAVRRAFEDDTDDAAVCLALLHSLELNADLVELGARWRSPLHNALARSQLLARVAAPLRLLRRAFADVYVDPRSELYRGIDSAACRRAFAQLDAAADVPSDLVVTVEPLGSFPLSKFRRLCLHDRRHRPGL